MQIVSDPIQPLKPWFFTNLFTKYDSRSALADKIEEDGPKVPLVVNPLSLSSSAEWLAGAASCPHWAAVVPPSQSSCVGPSSDSCEEVALGESFEFIGLNLLNASLVNFAIGDQSRFNQVTQPLGSVGVNLVIVGGHSYRP